jgi:hypothetical protein
MKPSNQHVAVPASGIVRIRKIIQGAMRLSVNPETDSAMTLVGEECCKKSSRCFGRVFFAPIAESFCDMDANATCCAATVGALCRTGIYAV